MSRRPWKRCPACHGICHWHETAWVCDDCDSEWMPPPDGHGPEWAAPSESKPHRAQAGAGE
jgi:hypothetical protein